MKLFIALVLIFLGAATGVTVTTLIKSLNKQEKAPLTDSSKYEDGEELGNVPWKIIHDTVYIDRSRPLNKSYNVHEIESDGDSLYIYNGRELLGVFSIKNATPYLIDSILTFE